MRRLAVLSRHDIISSALVDQQLDAGQEVASPPAESRFGDESLQLAIEQYLTNYFARYGDKLPPDGLHHRLIETLERPLLRATMAAVRGNQIRAAKLLGINRNTLRKRLTDLGIDPSLGRQAKH
jgi:two-component system, NtrC family, nitrogen regulation response regulator GlnG